MLLRRFIRRKLDAFERANAYDMSYARAVLDADASAFFAMARFQSIAAYDGGLPADAVFAAKLASTVAEDCGPCTQLVASSRSTSCATPTSSRASGPEGPGTRSA